MEKRFYKKLYINRRENNISDITCLYASGADLTVPSEEIHNHYEIIFFISGEADLATEFGQQRLKPNTAIFLPPKAYHKLIISEEKMLYKRIVLAFHQIPELGELINEKMKEFTLLESEDLTYLFMQITNLYDSRYSTIERDALCKAFLSQILVALTTETHKNSISFRINPIVEKTISYIKENLNKKISLDELSALHNISRSTLTTLFKKEMNISIYKFILSKRLIMAEEKISNGARPMQVAIECGFDDYSGFYKQYKKMFNKSPSAH